MLLLNESMNQADLPVEAVVWFGHDPADLAKECVHETNVPLVVSEPLAAVEASDNARPVDIFFARSL